jgi:hypothetical protein
LGSDAAGLATSARVASAGIIGKAFLAIEGGNNAEDFGCRKGHKSEQKQSKESTHGQFVLIEFPKLALFPPIHSPSKNFCPMFEGTSSRGK